MIPGLNLRLKTVIDYQDTLTSSSTRIVQALTKAHSSYQSFQPTASRLSGGFRFVLNSQLKHLRNNNSTNSQSHERPKPRPQENLKNSPWHHRHARLLSALHLYHLNANMKKINWRPEEASKMKVVVNSLTMSRLYSSKIGMYHKLITVL